MSSGGVTATLPSCIQHVPLVAQDPTDRRELAVEHAPFKIGPGAKFIWELFFCALHRGQHPVPDSVNDHASSFLGGCCVVHFSRDPLLYAAFNAVDDAP